MKYEEITLSTKTICTGRQGYRRLWHAAGLMLMSVHAAPLIVTGAKKPHPCHQIASSITSRYDHLFLLSPSTPIQASLGIGSPPLDRFSHMVELTVDVLYNLSAYFDERDLRNFSLIITVQNHHYQIRLTRSPRHRSRTLESHTGACEQLQICATRQSTRATPRRLPSRPRWRVQ
jgi:hypothetical protein